MRPRPIPVQPRDEAAALTVLVELLAWWDGETGSADDLETVVNRARAVIADIGHGRP